MTFPTLLRTACAITLASFLGTALADSFASSASSAGSASSGSVSNSLGSSSNSSSDNETVANGDYRILDIAAIPEGDNRRRLTLQADETPHRFQLDLPVDTLTRARLRRGDRVHVQQRVYGLQFARSDNREAFYLVLHDNWHDELAARPLSRTL